MHLKVQYLEQHQNVESIQFFKRDFRTVVKAQPHNEAERNVEVLRRRLLSAVYTSARVSIYIYFSIYLIVVIKREKTDWR